MFERVACGLTKIAYASNRTLTTLAETIADLYQKLKNPPATAGPSAGFSSTDLIRLLRILRYLGLYHTENSNDQVLLSIIPRFPILKFEHRSYHPCKRR